MFNVEKEGDTGYHIVRLGGLDGVRDGIRTEDYLRYIAYDKLDEYEKYLYTEAVHILCNIKDTEGTGEYRELLDKYVQLFKVLHEAVKDYTDERGNVPDDVQEKVIEVFNMIKEEMDEKNKEMERERKREITKKVQELDRVIEEVKEKRPPVKSTREIDRLYESIDELEEYLKEKGK